MRVRPKTVGITFGRSNAAVRKAVAGRHGIKPAFASAAMGYTKALLACSGREEWP